MDFKVGDKFTLECTVVEIPPIGIYVVLDGDDPELRRHYVNHTGRSDGVFKNYKPATPKPKAGQIWKNNNNTPCKVLYVDEHTILVRTSNVSHTYIPMWFDKYFEYVSG